MENISIKNVDGNQPEMDKVNAPEDQTTPNSKEDQTTAELTNDVDNLKAQHEAAMAEYASYGRYTKYAIRDSLLLMRGLKGGGFYVKFIQDAGTCYGWLNLIIVYPDGTFKSILSYKNFLKEADTEQNNGVYIAPEVKKPKGYYTYVDWDGHAPENIGNYSSLEQYATTQMPIPEKALWHKILEHYWKIPVVKVAQTASIEQLVAELQEWAEIHSNDLNQGFLDEKDRFYVTPEAFEEIVKSNHWYVSKAKVELDVLGIFDKDPSSKGYQKSKRVGREVKRFYALKKNPFDVPTRPAAVDDVKFRSGYEAWAERDRKKREEREQEYRDLVAKYNSLAAKVEGAEPEI